MFYKRLNDLCKDRGITTSAMLKELKLSTGSLSRWKRGTIPSGKTLEQLANFLDVSTDYLLGKTEKSAINDGLSENRRKLIQFVETVPDDKAELILRVMKSILEDD